jgi:aminopeptidase N
MPSLRARVLIGLSLVAAVSPRILPAQRSSGVIGAYVPPRVWPQAPHPFDLLHQRIAVSFDSPRRALTGTVTTRLVIRGSSTDAIRLDAERLTIDAASAATGRPLDFTFDTTHVVVRLPRPAAPGDTVEFTLHYHGTPERGVYFVPRRNVVWSQGEATETAAWVPTRGASNDKTTWEFLVTADSGLGVLSNGRLVGVTPVSGGRQNVWHWSQERPASTYLYSVVVGPFTVLKDQWRGMPVDYWVYPDTVDAAWRAFGETPAMLELYSTLLGVPFPWAKYDQSAIPDFTYGGMENVSATTQSDLALHPASDEPERGARGLVAHELAHQWFGDLTTTADWADIWLNEGLATYMESVQLEKSRGWEAGQLGWWQQQQRAMQADLVQERPLVWGEYEGGDPITLFFSGHVYPKGAQVAHQLRRLLGDSLFWAGMHRFLTDNAYRPVTTPDFAVAFEKACHCDLDWFFDQWAYGIGYPRVRFSRHWDSAARVLRLTVEQTQRIDSLHPLFRFPATVRVITRAAVVRREILVSRRREVFVISLPTAPQSVRFDEGGWLLGTVTGDLTHGELAAMAEHDLDFAARNWALQQLANVIDTAATAARRVIVLSEHDPWLRRAALKQLEHDSTAASLAVVRSALRDPESAVRAQALATLDSLDGPEAKTSAQAMVASDPSSTVRAEALAVYSHGAGIEALPALADAAAAGRPLPLRFAATRALARLHDPRAAGALDQLTASNEPRDLRIAGLRALVQSDPPRAVRVAVRALGDYDPLFAVAAAEALGRMPASDAREGLEAAERTETRSTVRAAIARALRP